MALSHSIRVAFAVIFLAFGSGIATAQPIDFGDDTSSWANDGECDDPRFEGAGAASVMVEADRGRDATDCRTLFEAGSITLIGGAGKDEQKLQDNSAPVTADIDFGDDTSLLANDGECDDPRFTGAHMAIELIEADRGRDASDCRSLYEEGLITLTAPPEQMVADIDFGDDLSQWSNDGECDDPRFDGEGSAVNLTDEHMGHDATDCRSLFLDGRVIYLGDDPSMDQISLDGVDFGNNTSQWAEDGECDDPTARNSNLLPVKANGDVRLRSVGSLAVSGRPATPTSSRRWATSSEFFPCMNASKPAVTSSPRYMDMMAGGASWPPRRWSLDAVAITALSSGP